MRSEEEITAALAANAVKVGDRWAFSSMRYTHDEDAARRIVESCLMLGQPVTDIVTTQAWLALVARVIVLQERVEALEAG